MAKGLVGGMTDYSHQSFEDILADIDYEIKNISAFIDMINSNISISEKNGYWNTNVPVGFISIVSYSLKHYSTSRDEFIDILKELKYEVKEHHCKRLQNIARVAGEINRDIGKIWHNQYDNKDYDEPKFKIIERIYCDTRDMSVNLLDISNIAYRLNDYIGKTKTSMRDNNNPWISGSFYLFVFIVVLVALVLATIYVNWIYFPIILISGILIIGVIGAFQLRNDDKLKEDNFLKLMTLTYKRLPLLKSNKK